MAITTKLSIYNLLPQILYTTGTVFLMKQPVPGGFVLITDHSPLTIHALHQVNPAGDVTFYAELFLYIYFEV
jgi:hypothetical protein